MLVRLSDLRMVYLNGTSVSWFGQSQSTALNACIDLGFTNMINLPYDLYLAFERICQCEDIGRSFGVNFYGELVANATTNELLTNSIQEVNENDMPILGRQFLSAAMLMANLDAQTSTLW